MSSYTSIRKLYSDNSAMASFKFSDFTVLLSSENCLKYINLDSTCANEKTRECKWDGDSFLGLLIIRAVTPRIWIKY